MRSLLPNLRLCVLFEGECPGWTAFADIAAAATEAHVDALGGRLRAARAEDLLTIIYTSGTIESLYS